MHRLQSSAAIVVDGDDVLPKLARVLRVTVEELLGEHVDAAETTPAAVLPGPHGQVQRAFDEVRKLPRRQQLKIAEFVTAFVNEHRRKAS